MRHHAWWRRVALWNFTRLRWASGWAPAATCSNPRRSAAQVRARLKPPGRHRGLCHTRRVLDDRALRNVAVVAKLGSIRAAARELGLAASAVQRSIAAAERMIGMQLFERSVRGVEITEAGRLVVAQAHDRHDLGVQLAAQLDGLKGLARGTVTIAAGEGFIADLWRKALDGFLEQHPGVSVCLHTAGSDDLVDLLITDTADVAIVLHPRPDPQVQIVRSRQEPLQVVCPPDHPFTRLDAVGPADLDGAFLAMLPERFGIRALQDQFLRHHGVSVTPRLESASQATLIRAVRSGRAVTLLPTVAVRSALDAGDVATVPIADTQLSRVRAGLLIRRDRRLVPAARAFVRMCAAAMFVGSPQR